MLLAICFVVCGWHYARIWLRFGNPLLGNWDVVSGSPGGQDPVITPRVITSFRPAPWCITLQRLRRFARWNLLHAMGRCFVRWNREFEHTWNSQYYWPVYLLVAYSHGADSHRRCRRDRRLFEPSSELFLY